MNQHLLCYIEWSTHLSTGEFMNTYDSAINIVRWVFTQLLYPLIIIGVFLLIIGFIFRIVDQGRGSGRVRRATGAVLPLIFLVFVLMLVEQANEPVQRFLSSTNPLYHWVAGAIIGVFLLELGIRLQKSDFEIGPALYTLFLSFVSMFILYSAMQRFLAQLNYFLISLIGTSGLYIIFRGLPTMDGFTSREEQINLTAALEKLRDEQLKLRREFTIIKNEVIKNTGPEKIKAVVSDALKSVLRNDFVASSPSRAKPVAPSPNVEPRFPMSNENLQKNYSSTAINAKVDFGSGLLIKDDSGKSEWLILENNILIPKLEKMMMKQEYHNYYEKFYSCKNPGAGEIWIMHPTIVSEVTEGWQMLEKGELEIR
jgi:hypothetical protein